MTGRRKVVHPVVHPKYLAELRRRIEEGPGVSAVARVAGMSRMTLWGMLRAVEDRGTTSDNAERARLALASLEPGVEPMPPPSVSVIDGVHHRWIDLGTKLLAKDPAAVAAAVAAPDALVAAVRRLTPGKRRR